MSTQQRYKKHFIISLLLHLILLSVLILSFEFNSTMPVMNNSGKEIIEAVVLDKVPSPKKIVQSPLPQPILKPVTPLEPVKPAKIESPPPKKEETIAILDKKQKKLHEDLLQKELLADLQKHREKKQKVIEQKNLQAEFEKEMKQLQMKAIQHQAQQEQKRIDGVRSQQAKGVVNKYKALILQTISQHWLIPPNVDKKRSAELLIRVAPGGVVLDVQLTKSSGDDALDRSARAAVLKSSPLPVPPDVDAFEPFRQFVLKVKPENILTSDSWMG